MSNQAAVWAVQSNLSLNQPHEESPQRAVRATVSGIDRLPLTDLTAVHDQQAEGPADRSGSAWIEVCLESAFPTRERMLRFRVFLANHIRGQFFVFDDPHTGKPNTREPSCTCVGDTAQCTVLVALRLGRSYIGIELNAKYIAMFEGRIREDAPLLGQRGRA